MTTRRHGDPDPTDPLVNGVTGPRMPDLSRSRELLRGVPPADLDRRTCAICGTLVHEGRTSLAGMHPTPTGPPCRGAGLFVAPYEQRDASFMLAHLLVVARDQSGRFVQFEGVNDTTADEAGLQLFFEPNIPGHRRRYFRVRLTGPFYE